MVQPHALLLVYAPRVGTRGQELELEDNEPVGIEKSGHETKGSIDSAATYNSVVLFVMHSL
jgi:hypothetical protein